MPISKSVRLIQIRGKFRSIGNTSYIRHLHETRQLPQDLMNGFGISE